MQLIAINTIVIAVKVSVTVIEIQIIRVNYFLLALRFVARVLI